jgi:rod shape determining protein RodA
MTTNKFFLYIKNVDWFLFFSFFILICFGIIEIYSIALSQNSADLLNFKKQVLYVIFGLAIFFVLSSIDFNNIKQLSLILYILGVILLVLVLFFGRTVRGTRGWLYIGGNGIQPVEFIKIIFLVFFAKYFSAIKTKAKEFKHIVISGSFCLLIVLLVMLQPDFGSAMLLLFIWFSMLFIVGINKKYFLVMILVIGIIASSGWFIFFQDYQKQRIITFINPSSDPLYRGYNALQAMIAVGSGGLIGRGVGFGSQSQLKFLPESQNDFIFAVIAEELGFFGVTIVFLFFALFYYRLIVNAKKTSDLFGYYYLMGLLSLIFVEMLINISMNVGIMPVIGISLPFLSYGGSGIISTLMMIGIAESIIIRTSHKLKI